MLAVSPTDAQAIALLSVGRVRARRSIVDILAPSRPLRPSQQTPEGDWRTWLLLGGRGMGKTLAGAEDVKHYGLTHPGSRIAIVAPTYADARDTCVEGESGLLGCLPPHTVLNWNRSMGELILTNGTRYKLFSADEPERLRGPQHHRAWCDELGAWKRPETWDMLMFGLRLGTDPQVVGTTTPRPTKLVRMLAEAPTTHLTRGTTYENLDNLPAAFAEQIIKRYEGTRLGRQELMAEILTDVPGALWTYAMLEDRKAAPDLLRCVVGVDPSGGSDPENDEQGIVVGGKGIDGHGYVVADRSCRLSPDGWGRRAVQAYVDFKADAIVVERNFGGDMAKAVVESAARAMSVTVDVKMVTASRGKALRAQPVAALYEQGLMHHTEVFAELEEQCVVQGTRVLTRGEWTPIEWIRVGDPVLTRAGLRRVLWAGQTGIARSIRIETENGLVLSATANHPIHTPDRGFVRADQIGPYDKITTCHNQFVGPLLSIADCGTSSTTVDISEPADQTAGVFSTGISTWTPTGRSLSGTTSTIGTTISRTTTPATSLPLRRANTDWSMDREAIRHGPLSSIARRLNASGSGLNRASGSASLVVDPSNLQVSERRSVDGLANVATVRSVQVCPDPVPVWNLTVEDQPEFFANGILTHNCTTWTPESGISPDRLDALVWMATETMLGPTPEWNFY